MEQGNDNLLEVLRGLLTSSPIDDLKEDGWKRKALGGAKIAGGIAAAPMVPIAANMAAGLGAHALTAGVPGAVTAGQIPISGTLANKIYDTIMNYPKTWGSDNPPPIFKK
jgi:hypothetical protein